MQTDLRGHDEGRLRPPRPRQRARLWNRGNIVTPGPWWRCRSIPPKPVGAVIVVLHDLGLAAAHAHPVATTSHGRVAVQGAAPADVFAGSFLSVVWRHGAEVLPHPEHRVPLPGRAPSQGVRPQATPQG